MQQGGARGALALLGALLGITLSVFKLIPEVSKYDLDALASAVMVACTGLAYVLVYVGIGVGVVGKRYRPGTRATWSALFATGIVAFVVIVAIRLIAGEPLTEDDVSTFIEAETSSKWIASIVPPLFAAGGFWAYRTWMSHRDEREQQCPWCKEWVKLDARKCRYCGSDLEKQKQEQAQQERQPAQPV